MIFNSSKLFFWHFPGYSFIAPASCFEHIASLLLLLWMDMIVAKNNQSDPQQKDSFTNYICVYFLCFVFDRFPLGGEQTRVLFKNVDHWMEMDVKIESNLL